MKTYTYIDNSNLFIEGQRVSAVKRGFASNIYDAMNNGIVDKSWNIDYGKLHAFLCGQQNTQIGGVRLWGSPPPSDTFWEMVKQSGFDVKVYDKNMANKEKKVDVGIAHRITKDAYTIIDKANDKITLVTGDRDFEPVISDLVSEGYSVTVMFWGHAPQEIRSAASNFINLNSYIGAISI